VKPAPFDYVRAASLEEALDALHQDGSDARVLAGGQTLLPMLNMRMARPRVLVDIMRLPELDRIELIDGAIRVGATVRQRALEEHAAIVSHQPLLAAALPWVGHAQTRSRGTVCGSVAHADPSAELPLVLIALGGEVELRSQRASRRIPAESFLAGMMSTNWSKRCDFPRGAPAPDMLSARSGGGTEILPSSPAQPSWIPAPPGSRSAVLPIVRRHGSCRCPTTPRSTRRSTRSPGISMRTATCTRRPPTGAT
jgi:FAD binding domain in molybdopterin dehydrogenase